MFLTISSGLDGGYYVMLADDAGPICRIECTDADTYDECCEIARLISRTDRIQFIP